MEETGKLPPEALAAWAQEFHASVSFCPQRLQAPLHVSVVWAGSDLPEVMRTRDENEFSAIWSVQDDIDYQI